ncbi:S8 family serine peptidase [Roseateles sp. DAIF2]|uniref:S8 family peptidase n=1 Tax=Roseateles sp. DAIF2 TaxID=2714952 RepID=UPI0018A30F75|nr:S8 family peptidase [Roseateles sp. DAIF2]QPF71608.1 S8 family serine peptidase [Roseateles sp. DAIF2]
MQKSQQSQLQAAGSLRARTQLALNAANVVGASLRPLRETAQRAQVLQLDRPLSVAAVAQMAAQLRRDDPDVEYAEPDLRMRPHWTPADPYYGSLWALHDPLAGIRLASAWDRSRGQGVTVAVLDTGYTAHADLQPNLLPGYDFIGDAARARDGDGRDANAADQGDWRYAGECPAPMGGAANSSWHGTHVAGTIAALADNGVGIAGVAPQAKILPLRVLGKCGGYTSDIADAIVWAAGASVWGLPANPYPAKILNLSLGGVGSCGQTYQDAVNTARNLGALVIASAGNDDTDVLNATPANCTGVLAVAATDTQGSKASFSNYGYRISLAAPGVSIYSTYNSGSNWPATETYQYMQGTSMAAPHVSGVAALMLAANPYLNDRDLERLLLRTVRAFPGSCSSCGAGLLDAAAAVAVAAGNPAAAPTVEIMSLAFSGGLGQTAREAMVTNGQGPYAYQWAVSNPEFRLQTPTARNTRINASVPYCETVSTNLMLTVTDAQGRSGSASTSIRFTSPRVPGRQCP